MVDHMTVFLFYSTGHTLCNYVAMQLRDLECVGTASQLLCYVALYSGLDTGVELERRHSNSFKKI